jgi:hypothetical protein
VIKVFTSPTSAIAELAQQYLEAHEVRTELRNDKLISTAGVATAWGEVWVEVWVVDERQEALARTLIEDFEGKSESDETEWRCPTCEMKLQPQFGLCWRCGTERPD